MPCNESQQERDHYAKQHPDTGSDLQARLNVVTDLLCKVGKAIKNQEPLPQDVAEWMARHAKADIDRGQPW